MTDDDCQPSAALALERARARRCIPKARRGIVRQSWPFLGLGILCFLAAILFANGKPWFGLESQGIWIMSCAVVGMIMAFSTVPPFVARVCSGALFLRLAVALCCFGYLYSSYGFAGFEGNDDLHWDRQARQVVGGQSRWQDVLRNDFSPGYVLVTAATYKAVGAGPLAPRILNALLGSLLVLAVYVLARELQGDEGLSRLAAYWIALSPVLVYWSITFQKDILLALVLCFGLLMCVRLFRGGATLPIIVYLAASAVTLALIRPLAAHILLFTIGLSAVYRLKVRGVMRGISAVGTMALATILVMAAIAFGLDRTDLTDFQTQYLDRAAGFERSAVQAEGGVSTLLAGWPRTVRMLIGPVITVLSPLPPRLVWDDNFSYSFMSLFQPLQVLLLPYFVARLWKVVTDRSLRRTGAVLLVPAIILALAANSVYAVGQITKYRVMVEPLILLLGAWEFRYASRAARAACLLISGSLAAGAVLGYVLLKAMT